MFPHQFGRANPGGELLAYFSQRMKVPESPLLFFISFQKFPWLCAGPVPTDSTNLFENKRTIAWWCSYENPTENNRK